MDLTFFILFAGGKLDDHLQVWEAAKQSFLSDVIKKSTTIPDIEMKTKSDEQLIEELQQQPTAVDTFKIKDPLRDIITEIDRKKPPKIIHYPISLYNCGTIDGNIQTLDLLINTLHLKEGENIFKLSYDAINAAYNLKTSRERCLFLERIKNVIAMV